MKASCEGINAGAVFGSLTFLNFAIFMPQSWTIALLHHLTISQYVGLLGQAGLLWTVFCGTVGAYVPAVFRRLTA